MKLTTPPQLSKFYVTFQPRFELSGGSGICQMEAPTPKAGTPMAHSTTLPKKNAQKWKKWPRGEACVPDAPFPHGTANEFTKVRYLYCLGIWSCLAIISVAIFCRVVNITIIGKCLRYYEANFQLNWPYVKLKSLKYYKTTITLILLQSRQTECIN